MRGSRRFAPSGINRLQRSIRKLREASASGGYGGTGRVSRRAMFAHHGDEYPCNAVMTIVRIALATFDGRDTCRATTPSHAPLGVAS